MGLREPYCRCKPYHETVPCYRCDTCGELRNDTIGELVRKLDAVVKNHCGNEKLFCSTCTSARDLIARLKEGAKS